MIARVGAGLVSFMCCAFAYAGPAGVIVDAQWNPVPDADVVLVLSNWRGWGDKVLEKTTSGKDGRFGFTQKIEPQWGPKLGGVTPPGYGVVVRHPDIGAAMLAISSNQEEFATVQLLP